MLNLLPNFVQPMLGVPLAKLATPAGQLSIVYAHIVTILVCVGLGHRTRLGLDQRRDRPGHDGPAAFAARVANHRDGCARRRGNHRRGLLAASVWAGMGLGLLCVKFHHPPQLRVPARRRQPVRHDVLFHGHYDLRLLVNRDRWRTISIAGGFFVLSLILKFVARMWSGGAWLGDFSFLTLFRPQELILLPAADGWGGFRSNGILLLLGLAAYALAAVILWRRDIPLPCSSHTPLCRNL